MLSVILGIFPPSAVMPKPTPFRATPATRFFVIVGALGALFIYSAAALWRRDPAALYWTTLGYFSYELGLNVLLVTAAWFGLDAQRKVRTEAAEVHPALSVMIAAHNERGCIFDTLASVLSQTGVDLQVIVASDGSTDGMNKALISPFSSDRRRRTVALARRRPVLAHPAKIGQRRRPQRGVG